MSESEHPHPAAALLALRERIDSLDEQIQRLIAERARCALGVARVKFETELNRVGKATADGRSDVVFYRPEREAQVLRRVKAGNAGPLSDAAVVRLQREIISACMALEQTLTVVLPGIEGCHVSAAYRHFGQSVRCQALTDNAAVVQAVAHGGADFGLLSLERWATVAQWLGPLSGQALSICGEIQSGAFVVIGKQRVAPSGQDKTVLLVAATDRAGLLAGLARHGVDVLLVDQDVVLVSGHRDDPNLARALAAVTAGPVILGSYPCEVI